MCSIQFYLSFGLAKNCLTYSFFLIDVIARLEAVVLTLSLAFRLTAGNLDFSCFLTTAW